MFKFNKYQLAISTLITLFVFFVFAVEFYHTKRISNGQTVIIYQYVYVRPNFFSLQNWAWPIMYMVVFGGVFAVPLMDLGGDFHDVLIALLVGMVYGVFLGIISFITPYYMLIFLLVPLFLYLIKGD
jgi:hypothetical protein